ncbi:hypothetical protein C3B79_0828 [Aeromonas hydrophila]|nr:hypothetical protein C3B79_0828 [Aeromonas hydrophila]
MLRSERDPVKRVANKGGENGEEPALNHDEIAFCWPTRVGQNRLWDN